MYVPDTVLNLPNLSSRSLLYTCSYSGTYLLLILILAYMYLVISKTLGCVVYIANFVLRKGCIVGCKAIISVLRYMYMYMSFVVICTCTPNRDVLVYVWACSMHTQCCIRESACLGPIALQLDLSCNSKPHKECV